MPLKTPFQSSFEKHLFYPKPLRKCEKRKITNIDKLPMSISSLAYKTYFKNKEQAKEEKAALVENRKLQRLQQKESKEKNRKKSSARKSKKKTVPLCPTCDEDVLTDVEDEGLKNIGCDMCENWFHLKCTNIQAATIKEAENEYFICHLCGYE